ncbi:MAG: winged helix DNA-binding domain-containing protein, partial [Pyrinomonadaceae bacterium]
MVITSLDIASQRLRNQRLSSPHFKKPADVVKWLGAVQAQDYYGAKWALGQRMREATDEAIEQAFTEGTILRTHVMRPTWHFVAPADIRWMLKLTAPRVNATISSYYRKHELDQAVFRRTNKALANALKGGNHLTRDVLRKVVQQAGISTKGLRLVFMLARAELDGVICSGARRGKQFTYALLEERVPKTQALARDEALAELTLRYFTSHGPATVQDFAWWSGLTATDARAGLDMVQRHLFEEVIEGKPYWLSASMPTVKRASRVAHLLPTYDEYLIAYRDRTAALDPTYRKQAIAR